MRDSTRHEQAKQIPGASGKYITLGSGKRIIFSDTIVELERAQSAMIRWASRAFKLAGEEWDEDRLERFITFQGEIQRAWEHGLRELETARVTRQRIASLRVTAGRTPEEAAAFHAKADELERGLSKP